MNNKKQIIDIAIIYDFDGTLSPKNMQEYDFMNRIDQKPNEFWIESNTYAKENRMDRNLSYMMHMKEKCGIAKKAMKRSDLVECGKTVELYNGVIEWFEKIDKVGKANGAKIKHYVISSGLVEIIEGTPIFNSFDRIYACEFLYDENGAPCWPKNIINDTTKTRFLFMISKQKLDISDDIGVNEKTEAFPIPFKNMIYIGDGESDVPCMALLQKYDACTIAVYPPINKGEHKKSKDNKMNTAKKLQKDGRAKFIEPADYSENTSLFQLVKDQIQLISNRENLNNKSKEQIANN